MLTAPPFGLGTELAATGVNGPSTFPATAPALTMHYAAETSGVFVSLGAFAAEAGNWGDKDGALNDLDQGGLLIAEAGQAGPRGRHGLGAWTYTKKQPDLRSDAAMTRAWGAYLLAERAIGAYETDEASMVLRIGVSDGRTGDFKGSWIAGALIRGVLSGRPQSAASVGVRQAILSDPARRLARAAGAPLDTAELGVEAVLSDAVTDWLTVSGSLQVAPNPGADPARLSAVLVGLRLEVGL